MPKPIEEIQLKHLNQVNRATLLLVGLLSSGISLPSFAESKSVVQIAKAQNLSSEFLEFVGEFADDDDNLLTLLVEDADGNVSIDASGSDQHPEKNRMVQESSSTPSTKNRLIQEKSSSSSFSVRGEKK